MVPLWEITFLGTGAWVESQNLLIVSLSILNVAVGNCYGYWENIYLNYSS